MSMWVPFMSRSPLTQCNTSAGIRKKTLRNHFARKRRSPDCSCPSHLCLGMADTLCRAAVSSGTVHRHVTRASGMRFDVLQMTACRVHSLPRFCVPKLPKKMICLGFMKGYIDLPAPIEGADVRVGGSDAGPPVQHATGISDSGAARRRPLQSAGAATSRGDPWVERGAREIIRSVG